MQIIIVYCIILWKWKRVPGCEKHLIFFQRPWSPTTGTAFTMGGKNPKKSPNITKYIVEKQGNTKKHANFTFCYFCQDDWMTGDKGPSHHRRLEYYDYNHFDYYHYYCYYHQYFFPSLFACFLFSFLPFLPPSLFPCFLACCKNKTWKHLPKKAETNCCEKL